MPLQELPFLASLTVILAAYGLPLLLCAAAGYLLGSVNSSIILTRLFKNKEDIRDYGSGNAGMTNVLRSVGKLPAALTFVGDFLKCVAAVLLAWGIMSLFGVEGGEWVKAGQYAAGVACVLGHMFPLYYGFKGGKGIVTSAAMIALLDWRVFLLIISTFLIVFIWKRIISLASIVCAALYPVYTFLVLFFLDYSKRECALLYLASVTAVALFIGGIVLWKHRSNIGRLRRGEERPITLGKKPAEKG